MSNLGNSSSKSDREVLVQCFGEPLEVPRSRSSLAVEILAFQISYGGTDDLEQLAHAGLVFHPEAQGLRLND
jgi:hypothetical protein